MGNIVFQLRHNQHNTPLPTLSHQLSVAALVDVLAAVVIGILVALKEDESTVLMNVVGWVLVVYSFVDAWVLWKKSKLIGKEQAAPKRRTVGKYQCRWETLQ
jgi:hypothetical protein